MTREENSIHESDPGRLAELMEAGDRPVWAPEELEAVLAHELSAPLELALPGAAPLLARLEPAAEPPENLGELLRCPDPPVELLRLGKEFAKSSRANAGALPAEVATVLYFACIAAALLHAGARITELDDRALGQGMRWAAGRPYLDGPTRTLLQDTPHALDPSPDDA